MPNDRLEREEEIKRIVASAQRLAKRMNASFVLDDEKLSDFPRSEDHTNNLMGSSDSSDNLGLPLSC